ncbi:MULTISPECIES: SDR family NAD(P)-dependent oxidoreductase [Halobacillus]|uniref:Short-chain dehydrogenase/reductase family protein n=1 Tax=Halobacillus halophilus (strain ATCC 35676 / DSM 2266 / JCM 20832 / KCTC 3685 / LMG 17431 / NBRC 102448 / NCIMB 2269) TaxID=866895 RepID=I0JRC5_HALH3|nr:glucose 1-dehydrogenase [Halobacillus halophilus]ASF40679.1 short-chain dehydrogenase [Halobacillus halophilus]CCG46695.1 short-chain dehydrogenase/reductase family protein [Halobacillus halophilus DSM 2266]
MKLKGKVAVVTGGSSGIGEAAVKDFCEQGAKVVIADLNEQGSELSSQLNDQGYETVFQKTDVTSEEDIKNMVQTAVGTFGSLDILFANAGIGDATPAHELSYEEWKKLMDVNINGVFLSNKYAITQMLEQENGGAIVNNASILGHVGQDSVTSYAAAKGGVVNLTRTLGVTYAKNNIRVNAVCPGYVETAILENADEEMRQGLAGAHPIGRLGQPKEIAKAVSFLASDDASFMVGANMLVDGGYTAQ